MNNTNKAARFLTILIISLTPLAYRFATDIFKIGIKDGKATKAAMARPPAVK